jgi:hypothetical protein
MKLRQLLIILLLCAIAENSIAQNTLILQGTFKEKDLYVKNPFSADGVGFCAFQVEVNGQVSSDEVNSSAFIVDLQQYGFEIGQEVEVKILHKDNCQPQFINPEAIAPEPTFEITSIRLEPNGMLLWKTVLESGPLAYVIEQFKWNKWIKVGEVMGKGSANENSYTFQAELHHGENKLRIYQGDERESRKYSANVTVLSNRPAPIELLTERFRESIEFSGPTAFEIFNEYGELEMKGNSKRIDISSLEKGIYYLNYANVAGKEFRKK